MQPAGAAPSAPEALSVVGGLADLARRAGLPGDVAGALEAELLGLGAADVSEVTVGDWPALASWALLKPFEQRRLLKAVPR